MGVNGLWERRGIVFRFQLDSFYFKMGTPIRVCMDSQTR
jgi:hypothetical protein